MKRENKMGRATVGFGVPVLIATILIFSGVITIAADERGSATYIVDGYAVYCNGGNADGATVLLTPSSGSSVTTTVGPAGGWPTGYWQINVGSIGGPGWEYGTTFSVLITTSGWSGSQSGFTIVDDGNYHTYTGTTTLNPTTSVVATAGAYPTTIVEGESVDFTGSATGGTGVYTWYWDFDGDGTSAEQNPSHTFNDEGTYVCTLTATDECSNSDDDTVTITIKVNASPPVFSSESPSDGISSISVGLSKLCVDIDDPDDAIDWTIETSPDIGSSSSGTGEPEGVKTCSISGLQYGTVYTWYVNATDPNGSNSWTGDTYTFTTTTETNGKTTGVLTLTPLGLVMLVVLLSLVALVVIRRKRCK